MTESATSASHVQTPTNQSPHSDMETQQGGDINNHVETPSITIHTSTTGSTPQLYKWAVHVVLLLFVRKRKVLQVKVMKKWDLDGKLPLTIWTFAKK